MKKTALPLLHLNRETLRSLVLEQHQVMGAFTSVATCPRQHTCTECSNAADVC